MEMSVIVQVRTVTTGRAVEIHLLYQTSLCQGFQTVVNRRQGDAWHVLLCPLEHFLHRGVIALPHDYIIHLPTLTREAQVGSFFPDKGRAKV